MFSPSFFGCDTASNIILLSSCNSISSWSQAIHYLARDVWFLHRECVATDLTHNKLECAVDLPRFECLVIGIIVRHRWQFPRGLHGQVCHLVQHFDLVLWVNHFVPFTVLKGVFPLVVLDVQRVVHQSKKDRSLLHIMSNYFTNGCEIGWHDVWNNSCFYSLFCVDLVLEITDGRAAAEGWNLNTGASAHHGGQTVSDLSTNIHWKSDSTKTRKQESKSIASIRLNPLKLPGGFFFRYR